MFVPTLVVDTRSKSVLDKNWKSKRIGSISLLWFEKFWYNFLKKKKPSELHLPSPHLRNIMIYRALSSNNVCDFLNGSNINLEFSWSVGKVLVTGILKKYRAFLRFVLFCDASLTVACRNLIRTTSSFKQI